jgi:hypothetical protein
MSFTDAIDLNEMRGFRWVTGIQTLKLSNEIDSGYIKKREMFSPAEHGFTWMIFQ